jgi:cytidylate kinase
MRDIVIAIDGPAGAGKSTVSKALADALGIERLDTGAMYRAVAAAAIEGGCSLDDVESLVVLARSLGEVSSTSAMVGDIDVLDHLRSDRVNVAVSKVAATAEVRAVLVAHQRKWVADRRGSGVVEGRDIASVVFPSATVKVYLTASVEERARRRAEEGVDGVTRRDTVDSTRAASPLTVADGSVILDTTGRTIEDVTSEILSWLP